MSRINYKKNVRIEITQRIPEPGTFFSHPGNTHWQEHHEAKNAVEVGNTATRMAEEVLAQVRRHVDIEGGHATIAYEVVNACAYCLDESKWGDNIPGCCDAAQRDWLVVHTAEEAAHQDELEGYDDTYRAYRLEVLADIEKANEVGSRAVTPTSTTQGETTMNENTYEAGQKVLIDNISFLERDQYPSTPFEGTYVLTDGPTEPLHRIEFRHLGELCEDHFYSDEVSAA